MHSAPLLNRTASRPTQRLLILGASGSVGTTTLNYLETRPDIALDGVSVHANTRRLEQLLQEFPTIHLACISDADVFDEARRTGLQARHPAVRFFRGEAGLCDITRAAAYEGTDTVLTAVVGACGIQATVAAIESSLKVALANKETLVTAGPAIRALMGGAARRGIGPCILPVDSEHNALFQLLLGTPEGHIRRLVLTASGGPFRDLPLDRVAHVTREEVLQHPTWNMGPKISVDSAGMINKGLEIIEAHFLFGVPYEKLAACIHRKSVVHGLLETTDGGFLLAASAPDMVFPIAHTLCYPDAVPVVHSAALSPPEWPALSFEDVDESRYPGYVLCLQAGRVGGTAPAILNAANEVAVELFLEERLRFADLAPFVASVLDRVAVEQGEELELFLDADRVARHASRQLSGTPRVVPS